MCKGFDQLERSSERRRAGDKLRNVKVFWITAPKPQFHEIFKTHVYI